MFQPASWLAATAILVTGCSTQIGLPVTPLAISTDRYLRPTLKIQGNEVGVRVRSKKGELLSISGEFSRLPTEHRSSGLMGVAFQFRCNNASVNKTLERELKTLPLITDFQTYPEYATEIDGVVTFQGKLPVPKRVGEYELYLSAFELKKTPSGTAVYAEYVPLVRTVMLVE